MVKPLSVVSEAAIVILIAASPRNTHTPSSTQGKQILILTTVTTLALVDLSSTRDISP